MDLDCHQFGIDLSLSAKEMAFQKNGEDKLEVKFPGGPCNLIFLPSFQKDQKGTFSWFFTLSGNHLVTIAVGSETNVQDPRYLLERSPVGFQNSLLNDNQKLIPFLMEFRTKLSLTLIIDFDRKCFVMEAIDSAKEQTKSFKADLSVLEEKDFPLRVGVSGYHGTTVTLKTDLGISIKPAKR